MTKIAKNIQFAANKNVINEKGISPNFFKLRKISLLFFLSFFGNLQLCKKRLKKARGKFIKKGSADKNMKIQENSEQIRDGSRDP